MPERATTTRERRLVVERAGGRCEYCLSPAAYSPDPFAIEHIVPRSRGGSHRPFNLRRIRMRTPLDEVEAWLARARGKLANGGLRESDLDELSAALRGSR